jgi:hypothetical protein
VPATIRTSADIDAHLDHLTEGVVFQQSDVGDEWADVAAELRAAFEVSKPAAVFGHPVVYIVSSDALLGRTGRGNAMVATGLLSAARTLAAEMRRDGVPVNVLGIGGDTPNETTATWVSLLLEQGGPTGELVQLGGGQIGKALP